MQNLSFRLVRNFSVRHTRLVSRCEVKRSVRPKEDTLCTDFLDSKLDQTGKDRIRRRRIGPNVAVGTALDGLDLLLRAK